MRVLWFTNIPLKQAEIHNGRTPRGSGHWMNALLESITAANQPLEKVAVVTSNFGDKQDHFEFENIDYFNIKAPSKVSLLLNRNETQRQLQEAAKIIESWKPDLIHVHGTERFFGLVRARKLTSVPTVVSLQGIVTEIARYASGDLTLQLQRSNFSLSEALRRNSPSDNQRRFHKQALVEQEILKGVDAVAGRTAWDKAFAKSINPELKYFHIDEMLRTEFQESLKWKLQQNSLKLFTTSGIGPLKGLGVLIKAIKTLRNNGHNVSLSIAGVNQAQTKSKCYGKYLADLIKSLELGSALDFLGWCNPQQLMENMLSCRCFISPSFIENSPNSICEAQMLGVPCVAADTGGIPSLITDSVTGMLFSRGDSHSLADQVTRLLEDNSLCDTISKNAIEVASKRHSEEKIRNSTIACYQELAS